KIHALAMDKCLALIQHAFLHKPKRYLKDGQTKMMQRMQEILIFQLINFKTIRVFLENLDCSLHTGLIKEVFHHDRHSFRFNCINGTGISWLVYYLDCTYLCRDRSCFWRNLITRGLRSAGSG